MHCTNNNPLRRPGRGQYCDGLYQSNEWMHLDGSLGATSHGDIVSFRVRRVGGEVRIPGGPYSIDDSATFSAHLRSGSTGVEGTVEFTGDDPVTIDDGVAS